MSLLYPTQGSKLTYSKMRNLTLAQGWTCDFYLHPCFSFEILLQQYNNIGYFRGEKYLVYKENLTKAISQTNVVCCATLDLL